MFRRRFRPRVYDEISQAEYQKIMRWWNTRDEPTKFFLISEVYKDWGY